jgi:hypothetical protein
MHSPLLVKDGRYLYLQIPVVGAETGRLLVGCFLCAVLTAHHVPVEHWETDKECDADQVFNRFDVLVKINQRVNRLDLPNCTE